MKTNREAYSNGEKLATEQYADNKAGAAESAALDALSLHTENTANPHAVTKTQIGLGNADNTADIDKPLSLPQKNYVDGKTAGAYKDRGAVEFASLPAEPAEGDVYTITRQFTISGDLYAAGTKVVWTGVWNPLSPPMVGMSDSLVSDFSVLPGKIPVGADVIAVQDSEDSGSPKDNKRVTVNDVLDLLRSELYKETAIATLSPSGTVLYSDLSQYDVIRCEMYTVDSGDYVSEIVNGDAKTFKPSLLHRNTRTTGSVKEWAIDDGAGWSSASPQWVLVETYSDENSFLLGLESMYGAASQSSTAMGRASKSGGGYWYAVIETVPAQTFTSYGKVSFMGGSVSDYGYLRRSSVTQCTFVAPATVTGRAWRLDIVGIRT